MTWPPPQYPLSTSFANSTPQTNTHPTHHSDVGNVVNDLVEAANYKFASTATTLSNWSGQIDLRRTGHLVLAEWLLTASSAQTFTGPQTLATIPAGWRPRTTHYGFTLGWNANDEQDPPDSYGEVKHGGSGYTVVQTSGLLQVGFGVRNCTRLGGQMVWFIADADV